MAVINVLKTIRKLLRKMLQNLNTTCIQTNFSKEIVETNYNFLPSCRKVLRTSKVFSDP